MRTIFFLVCVSTLFIACSHEDAVSQETEVIVEESMIDETQVAPTHIATFEVEGMMCQKGCGSIIRKGLYETGGVSEVEVAFEDENPVNEIRVYFDKKNTSIEDMISVIGKLADNRYNAKLISISESTLSKS